MDDIILNKVASVKRCQKRIREEFNAEDEAAFRANFTRQDSVILNLQRACEACIDIANVLIKQRQLGIPQSARDSFELLVKAGLISVESGDKLKKMVGLRNIAVHDYQTLNLDIVIAVINKHLGDFDEYIAEVLGTL